MGIFDRIGNAIQGLLQRDTAAWWVEITTAKPHCTYYFGPFDSPEEAKAAHSGYVEDLESEGAEKISVEIKRCDPKELTICHDEVP